MTTVSKFDGCVGATLSEVKVWNSFQRQFRTRFITYLILPYEFSYFLPEESISVTLSSCNFLLIVPWFRPEIKGVRLITEKQPCQLLQCNEIYSSKSSNPKWRLSTRLRSWSLLLTQLVVTVRKASISMGRFHYYVYKINWKKTEITSKIHTTYPHFWLTKHNIFSELSG